jgi:signal peptidase I|tara:strand:+ start:668 stop:1408 length:741 start_codon:yes stop_codon:yes gene_type:complete
MKKNLYLIIIENVKTIFYALIIAVIIRSLFFQPFYIPSSSMEPTLLIGDRIFVSKYAYGYSKHSFPFSPPLFKKRLFAKKPNYGDLVVFKTPSDNRTDYIKRLIGMPGDKIQFQNGNLLLNNSPIARTRVDYEYKIRCGPYLPKVIAYKEILPNGKEYVAVYNKKVTMQNTDVYTVPEKHFFFLGDNRDCSKDSRYISSVGYVASENLVGKAKMIFFSNDTISGSILKFWNWDQSLRIKRFFNLLK